jgi:CheY-like chemotaxis protein
VAEELSDKAEPTPQVSTRSTGIEYLLLVEDDPAVQRVLREYLEAKGYTVYAADDGEAGLELARRKGVEVDLVLTDVVMPRMNGIELARRLREEMPYIKVLLISGHTKDRKLIMEEALKNPNCSFLQKPFAPEELARMIRELLDAE